MQRVTIVREYNCYESTPTFLNRIRLRLRLANSVPCRDFMSVWLLFKNGYEDYTQTRTRIIGPIRRDLAEAVIKQLESAFKSSSFDVVVENAADD